jgi:hypothetical protein
MTDTVYEQTRVDTNVYGSISTAWTESTGWPCDVQPISREKAIKDWGITDSNHVYEVFSCRQTTFTEGWQVKWNDEQYMVRVVKLYDKINMSDHNFMVMTKVVE